MTEWTLSAEPYVQLIWTDPESGRRGYLVVDTVVRGVASGGLRLRAGCDLDEVRRLARAMTLKEALNYEPGARYVPLGGAKGGIDCDPADPAAPGVLVRYLAAVRPYLEEVWTVGEDLGLSQGALDEAIAAVGLHSPVQAVFPLLDDEAEARERMAAALSATSEGLPLGSLVGGYGVARAAVAAFARRGLAVEGSRAVVQGFGSMGGASARYLAEAGFAVVGIADERGLVANPDGLDVESLLAARCGSGLVDRSALRPADVELPGERWVSLEAELLVPAAVSDCVSAQAAESLRAAVVVEAANLPLTAAADEVLFRRGVCVVPDIVANSATNSWWWWTLFGDIGPTAKDAFAKIARTMPRLVEEVLERSEVSGVAPRQAAAALACDRLRLLRGRFPPRP
jgi:glutamate dehydrogenase (NAD(P)+)